MDAGALVDLILKSILGLVLLLVLWMAGSVLVLALAFRQLSRHWQKLAQLDLTDIDGMTGKQFEEYLQGLFAQLGYKTEPTERFDRGADLILTKEGTRTAVQAKRKTTDKVGVEAVRAVVTALPAYKCTRGMVVTSSDFTRPARRAAHDHNIELWNRNDLAKLLYQLNYPDRAFPVPGPIAWLFDVPREITPIPLPAMPSNEPAVCATCQRPVSPATKRYCLQHAHVFRGQVYCYKHQQAIRKNLG